MIITQTPFRISFFGGGTDFQPFFEKYGGAVLSTSIDKYVYVQVRHLPPFFEWRNVLSYSKIEHVVNPNDFEHPLVRETMKYLDMHELSVHYDADLPARSGLGSSSAFAVGMINAFYSLKGKYASKNKLSSDAIYCERVLCKESGGWQDQIAVSHGGFNKITFSADGFNVAPVIISNMRKQNLNDNLMLFFTGFSRFSSEISEDQVKASETKVSELLEMMSLVADAERILTSKCDLDEFGRLLDYTWKIKRSLTKKVSNDAIDDIYSSAISAGAIGGKILGAGGGGFLLLYVPKEKQPNVLKELSNLLYVPFKFEDKGTNVIYYLSEDYTIPKE